MTKRISLFSAVLALAVSAHGQVVTLNAGDNILSTSLPEIIANFTYLDGKQLKGTGAPSAACDATHNLGFIYVRSDAVAVASTSYVCHEKADTTYAWELIGAAGASVAANANFTHGDGSGGIVDSGKAVPTGTVVGTSDTQTLTGKSIAGSEINSGTVPHAQLPALVSGDIPNNAANTSGLAGTATALAANGTNCSAGNYPLGVDASGNSEGCTAASGGSSFDPLDMTQPWGSYWLSDGNPTVTGTHTPWAETNNCAITGTGWGANGESASSVLPYTFYKTAGTTAQICLIYQPNSGNTNYGLPLPDLFSGSSPVTHVDKARFKVGDRNGDTYFGYSQSISSLSNFFGCRALKTDTNWFAVIINAGTVTAVDTGMPIVISTTDATGDAKLKVDNGAGVANSITCTINGTGATASGGQTIPTGTWYRVLGNVQQGATAATWGASWTGWKFSGVGAIQ